MKTLGEALPKKWRDKVLEFSKSEKLKKIQKAVKPYSTGAELRKTIGGKFSRLVKKLKSR